MRVRDIIGFFNIHILPLREQYPGAGGCTVFDFPLDGTDISWRAGQHAVFTLPARKVNGQQWRAFSIASVPEEGVVKIATKIPEKPSSFKSHLASLVPGDIVRMHGPYGWFYFRDATSPVVLIAGGVGSTPMRALFKELEHTGTKRPVEFIYGAEDSYLFHNDFDTVAGMYADVIVDYLHTPDEVAEQAKRAIATYGNGAYYFISGTPSMVKRIRMLLFEHDIKKDRVVNDSFRGYPL